MKKLIALLFLAGFLIVTAAGCPGQTTGGPKTGGSGTASGSGSGGTNK